MRVRERDYRVAGQFSGDYVNASCITGNNGTFSPWTAGLLGKLERTVDVVTPNYGKRRRSGEIIINPFSSLKTETTTSVEGYVVTSTCAAPKPNYTLTVNGPLFFHNIGNPVIKDLYNAEELDKAVSIASTKCWADVNQAETQLLVSLLEVKRTVSLLMRPLGNTLTFLSKVRSAKANSGFDTLTLAQYIAREWLTYRYGWSQLYRDTVSVLLAIGKKRRDGLTTARGIYTIDRQETSSLIAQPQGPGTEKFHLEFVHTDRLRVKCGLFYDSVLDVERYLGLSKYNILETAWEIIPFSFVVDWVVNVQNYLNALLPLAVVPVKGSYTTVERIKTVTRTCISVDVTPRDVPPSIIWSVVKHPAGADFTSERTKVRNPGIKPPSLNVDLKIKDFLDRRVVDTLALILNQLGKR